MGGAEGGTGREKWGTGGGEGIYRPDKEEGERGDGRCHVWSRNGFGDGFVISSLFPGQRRVLQL